jgi:hypothetical protein
MRANTSSSSWMTNLKGCPLAREQLHRKWLELHEGEAEYQDDRACAQGDPGDHDAVDHWPQQGVPEEPQ